MSGSDAAERVGAAIERTVRSGAVHAGFAVVVLGFVAVLVFDATSAVGLAPIEGRSLTLTRPLWIPLVLVWATVLLGTLALWLRRTEVPETISERRILRVGRLTKGLRWMVALGVVQVGFVLSVTWTKWLGLAFGYESAVTGPGSEAVLFAPFAVGGALLVAYSLLAFYRSRALA